MRFPSIKHVSKALRAESRTIGWCPCRDREECDYCDVRLQVYPDGAWAIRVGLSDYDLDHRGYWGASSIPRGRFNAANLARDLIEQCRDHEAENR